MCKVPSTKSKELRNTGAHKTMFWNIYFNFSTRQVVMCRLFFSIWKKVRDVHKVHVSFQLDGTPRKNPSAKQLIFDICSLQHNGVSSV